MNLEPYRGLPQYAIDTDPRLHAYSSYTDRSIERKQLHDCYKVVEENHEYLYREFTPTQTDYCRGTRPLLEAIVDKVCAGCAGERAKAVALVRWRRANITHLGKCGLGTEEEILLGGYSMCHDAARTLIALCQVAGMGARMILGLNDEKHNGHTLTEVFVDGRWALFDPSPGIAWPYYELPDGSLANGWDLKQDPSIPSRCRADFDSTLNPSEFFRDYRVANYPLEESTRNMARRFLRLVTAFKALDNYDYTGHLTQTPVASFLDLDKTLDNWLDATMKNTPRVP